MWYDGVGGAVQAKMEVLVVQTLRHEPSLVAFFRRDGRRLARDRSSGHFQAGTLQARVCALVCVRALLLSSASRLNHGVYRRLERNYAVPVLHRNRHAREGLGLGPVHIGPRAVGSRRQSELLGGRGLQHLHVRLVDHRPEGEGEVARPSCHAHGEPHGLVLVDPDPQGILTHAELYGIHVELAVRVGDEQIGELAGWRLLGAADCHGVVVLKTHGRVRYR